MNLNLRPCAFRFTAAATRTWRWWPALGLVAVLVGCGGGEGSSTSTITSGSASALQASVTKLESLTQSVQIDQRLAQIREVAAAKADRQDIPVVRLGAFVMPKQTSQEGALQIGGARDVGATTTTADLQGLLQWQTTAAGRQVAALRFESPAARGVRLGLQVAQLPLGSVLRVRASGEAQALELDAAEVARTIQRNLDAGVPVEQARRYWLPTVSGPEVTLEVELPAGMSKSSLQVSVPQLTHLWLLPEHLGTEQAKVGESSSCNVDVSCTTGNENQSRAVARMLFIEGGAGYLCSGALVNNVRSDFTPYFLTANHCISSQLTASTLETRWFYRSAFCGSSSVNSGMQTLRGGATLLYASANTDTSFMRLNDAAPAGAVFAGWDANPSSGSGFIKGVHHPRGDLQKVSTGVLAGFASCGSAMSGTFNCSGATQANGNHLVARWSSGITEGGSSGSPLFFGSGGSFYVIGQLAGGGSSCSARTNPDVYGRFDTAFEVGLKNWLAPTATVPSARVPVYRFYNARSGAHFYTNSVAERDFVIAQLPDFAYEGPRFQAVNQPGAGLSPVYRFYNHVTGAHFYTISVAERDFVISTIPDFKYEGPAWYAQTQDGNGSSAMHRFYNAQRGTHFYTIIPGEVDFVRERLPEFQYEGIGYYAWTN